MTDVDELRGQVASIRWFHSIDLGNGIVTPGVDRSARRLKGLRLPATLQGLTVLDIGTFDGFYAFEAERRGAARVVATDSAVWRNPAIGKAGFNLARSALRSKIEDREIDLLELSPGELGTFDLVLFLGVLYHVRDPLLALERVAAMAKNHLILETHVDMLGSRRPMAAFYPGKELKDDASNWWGPNPSAVVGMLKAVGFTRVEVVFTTPVAGRAARAVKNRQLGSSIFTTMRQGRAVFHAFK
jgi:tRNA (mo5U34)-methyltransferase